MPVAAFRRALMLAVFVGTFLAAPCAAFAQAGGFVYALNQVNGGANQLYGYSVDPTTGVLTGLAGFPVATGGNGASSAFAQQLFYDRANSRLFALNDGSDTVSVFAVNRFSGAVTALPYSPVALPAGNWGCVATDPTGAVLAAGNESSTVASFLITSTTATAGPGSPVGTGSGSAPFDCVFSHHGAYFYTGGYSGASFAGFAVNLATAALTPLAGSPFASGAANPVAFTTDALGRLFIANISSGVRAFTTAAGIPSPVAGNPFVSGLVGAINGVVSPSGLYLVADRSGNQIGAYSIGSGAALAAVAGSPFASGGTSTSALALDHRGALLFAGHGGSRNITTFRVTSAAPFVASLVTQGANTIGAAGNLSGVAFAPPAPGGFVYAVNQVSGGTNQVYGFSVNTSTGLLTPLPGFPVAAGTGGVSAFSDHVRYDPVNARLFVLNDTSGAGTISAFAVNRGTGALTALPFSPIALPAGAGSWGCVTTAGSGGSTLIAAGALGAASFRLTATTAIAAPGSPAAITGASAFSCAASQDGGFFYTGGTSGSAIAGFSVNAATGALTALAGSPFASGASNPVGYATDSSGRLFVSDFGSGLRAFTTTAGIPAAVAGNPFVSGLTDGINGILTATGLYVVADRSANRVGSFAISGSGAATTLTAAAGSPFAAGGTSTTTVAADDTGTLLFASNSASRNLTAFTIGSSGVLTSLGVQPANTLGATGNVTGIAFAPLSPGGFAYALNQVNGGTNQVYGFSVDTGGTLTALPGFPVAAGTGGGDFFSDRNFFSDQIRYDPINGRLFVLNDTAGGGSISAFAVSRSTGALTALPFSPIALPAGSGSWGCLAIAGSDGSTLIAAGALGAASFWLTATTAIPAPGSPAAITGASAFSCAASQDGGFFYTGGNSGSAIAGFSVNAATGALTALAGSPFASGAEFPTGYATDGSGRLFVSNFGGASLRAFTTAAGVPTGAAGNPFASGLIGGVHGVVTATGLYLVADRNDNRVGSFAIAGSGAATTLTAAPGSPFASGGTATNAVAADDSGTILLAANGTSRNLTTFSVNSSGVLTSLGIQTANTLGATGNVGGIAFASRLASSFAPSGLFISTIGPGTVTSDIGGLSCDSTCSAAFDAGTVVALTATPAAGFIFGGWTGGGCGSATTCLVTIEATTSITATFAFVINPSTIPTATAGVAYNQALTPAAGTGPYTFSITAGTPPAGITLSSAGVLSGTPTATSSPQIFTVHATDALAVPGNVTYSLAVGCPAIIVSPSSLAAPVLNSFYSQAFSQSGGVGAATFTITGGVLPAGLSLSSSGLLAGTPTAAGAAAFTVTATDSNGCTGSITATFAFVINPSTIPTATAGVAYNQALTPAAGTGPFTFSISSGAPPAGITLSSAGVLSGTPTVTSSAQIFTVHATDALAAAGNVTYSLAVGCPAIALSPTVLPNSPAGVEYPASTLSASGGVGTATFAVTSGALPAGMTLSSAGVVSGTPTVTGTSNFTVTATKFTVCSGQRAYTIAVVCPAITLSDTSFADGTVGNAYPPTTLTQTGGVGTIAFALTTGALPPGVTLSPAGTLSGTPTDAGAFTFTIAATDSNGCSGTRTYTMTVGGPPVMSLSLARLNYGVLTAAGGAWTLQTPSQTLGLSQAGAGAVTWTATASQPWISVSPSFGSGAAILTISVTDTGALPSPAALSGTITIATAGAANSPSAAVNLALYPGTTTPAIGVFDTPVDGSTALQGSFAVTGWAFDDIGVDRVEIWRDLQPGETTPPFASSASDPRNGKIYIGNGAFVAGSRPDVEAFGPLAPLNYRAGWGYLLLTWGLWNQGNGTFTLHAFAFDLEGKLSTLGRKTIGVANAQADRPFGSIDTPGIGGTATRTVVNFGWGLTPLVNGSATCRIPSTGVQVSIDSGPLQPVAYGDARSDIVGAFPGFSNTDAAGGHFIFDSTQLTNGTHTIGWFITDDCNRADGVGSRFFTVQNGAAIPALTSTLAPAVSAQAALDVADSADPITVSHGHGNLPAIVAPDSTGLRVIHVGQGERIEVRLPTGYDEAFQAVNGVRRALPAGASWDASSRTFFWQPAAPFLGSYDLLFPRNDAQIRVRIVVGAAKP